MFDPLQSAALRAPGPEGPLLANVLALSVLQREALVTLLCGSARRLSGPRWRTAFIADHLGESWSIEPATIAALARAGLVAVADGRAKLTPRGLWYARSAVHRTGEAGEATR